MIAERKQTLTGRRKEAIDIARQLHYGVRVIYNIETAKTISEIDRVMVQARKDWQNRF